MEVYNVDPKGYEMTGTPPYDGLVSIHRYLFPERYGDVPMYEWHAGTIEDVAAMVERLLRDAKPGTYCTCGDAGGPCDYCWAEAEEYVGKTVTDGLDRTWKVTEVGEKDGAMTISGDQYWSRPDDVEIVK